MSDSNKQNANKVTIMHRLNKLKLKAGVGLMDERMGFIDPKALLRAQASIDNKADSYSDEIKAVIVRLESTWDDLKKENDAKKRKRLTSELHNYANNVKDIAETFKYKLMGHFGKSLRDFCEKIDVGNKAHHIIVQAHIDVMDVACQQNIKDEGGPVANELISIVAKAIEQHS